MLYRRARDPSSWEPTFNMTPFGLGWSRPSSDDPLMALRTYFDRCTLSYSIQATYSVLTPNFCSIVHVIFHWSFVTSLWKRPAANFSPTGETSRCVPLSSSGNRHECHVLMRFRLAHLVTVLLNLICLLLRTDDIIRAGRKSNLCYQSRPKNSFEGSIR